MEYRVKLLEDCVVVLECSDVDKVIRFVVVENNIKGM